MKWTESITPFSTSDSSGRANKPFNDFLVQSQKLFLVLHRALPDYMALIDSPQDNTFFAASYRPRMLSKAFLNSI